MSDLFLSHLVASTSLTERFTNWSVQVMETLGAPGAGLLIALENIFPPLPSEVILPLAGFTASKGNLGLISAIIWTTAGSLVGALVLYYLGAWLGRDRIRALVKKLPLMKLSDIDKTEHWFATHQNQTVFWARMVPIVRSLISIPAGVERMPLQGFVVYTAAGSLVWNSALIMAGYTLGEQWHIVESYVGVLQYIVVGVAVVLGAMFVYRRTR